VVARHRLHPSRRRMLERRPRHRLPVSRPDVDPERIAVTGISGGGAATFWIAAADERVKCAVPASGMSDLESYVKNKVVNGHCDCMFVYNTYQWDWTTIAALVAPRPLLFANSDNDAIFPMDGNRRIIAKLRKIYKMYGKPELVDDYVSVGGHDYRPDLRVAIFKWINRHVKGDTTTVVKDVDAAEFPGKMLRVFRDDDSLPRDSKNDKIDEIFIEAAKWRLPHSSRFVQWKQALLKTLRESCFRPIPQPVPPAQYATFELLSAPGGGARSTTTEPNIHIRLNEQLAGQGHSTLVIQDLDAPDNALPSWAKPYVKGPAADLLTANLLIPRGVGMQTWTRKSPPNYVERSHLLLGLTTDQGRLRDILSVCRLYRQDVAPSTPTAPRKLKLLGRRQAGILAAYAALFEPSIKEVVIIDPPKSHKEGPYFLNVLQVLDIPEALGLLAPNVKLTLVNARDPAFDRTAEIYRLAGAAEKLIRK
jgi:hypothetical protein